MIGRRALAVFRFEFGRSLTVSRLTGWLVLVLFPVFLISIVKYYDVNADPLAGMPHVTQPTWGTFLFGLIPEVITLLGLLLWATPVVHSELEGRTWIFVAVRPRGRVSILLGKYLAAVAWTVLAGWTSASVCILIIHPQHPWQLWLVINALVLLSSVAYGALYCMIGTLIQQRAMVIAVAYTLIFEFLISLVPALFNKLTISYRLRNLLFNWMSWRDQLDPNIRVIMGDEPSWLHLVVLGCITVALLVAAIQIIQRTEYVTAREA